ncbi:glycoside hydrolase family 15 [Oerskovia flava]|uniref:glycoside hydrolase family 15 n=1 Tax=Oerskovia flava TaxID=2986422 RepID=UPI00223E943B|nr:glycoside hydrolase family 15 [Oerskovia sp. JB1-3-2]
MIRATSRWRYVAVGLAVALPATLLASGAGVAPPAEPGEHIDLYQDGVALTADGTLLQVPPGGGVTYLDGSRVLDPDALDPALFAAGIEWGDDDGTRLAHVAGPTTRTTTLADADAAHDAARASQDWLAEGETPGRGGGFEELGVSALLDMHALTLPNGASLAAPSPYWRYVWPRDSSFVAAAYARTGHVEDAVRVLTFLQEVQEDDGSFHARYLPDGSGVPDDRGLQSDGNGWALWSVGVLLDEIGDPARRDAVARGLAPLLDASTDHVLDLVDTPSGLPPVSSDYWEVDEEVLTLGTAAPLLAGLEAAAALYPTVDWRSPTAELRAADRAARARVAAQRLRSAVEATFGPEYSRHATGGPQDAATAFVLPPFQPEALAGAPEAWTASATPMLRPAGGLAPGAGWREDGISWTPQTSLYALAAASNGHPEIAGAALHWLEEHRTTSGALPEKVLADGSPAAVAPLAWTSAVVVLTLVELDAAR